MAESLTRRDALKSAWVEWNDGEDDVTAINYQFEAGFSAAWDALIAEIGPLTEFIRTGVTSSHDHAVQRLRDLVRELEGGT